MKKCRLCNTGKFDDVLDMGDNALVNSLIDKKDLDKGEVTYPLKVVRCRSCGLVQVEKPIDSHKIYKEVDYLYFSSDMPGLKEYFGTYAQDLYTRFLQSNSFVVEIGSNDGLMLSFFQNEGMNVLGVDPATNVVLRAIHRNVPTLPLFFEERIAKLIAAEFGQPQVIYANNCIAHIDDLDSVMKGVQALLRDDGVFVVECNYWGGMVKNKNYALVYHDHFSYFSLQDWRNYAPKFGLSVFDATVTPAQGGSLRVLMQKGTSYATTERYKALLKDDKRFTSLAAAQQYGKDCIDEAKKLFALVNQLKKEGKTIAGYGAAAKGFSVLKLAGIDERHLDYFVDDSPAKQGKYTPVTHIPVISRKEAQEKLPDYFFITAPNYADTIIKKERDFMLKGGKFILTSADIVEGVSK